MQRQNDLKIQFKDALLSAAGAMRAGYSIENAWREAKKDVIQQYGKFLRITTIKTKV